MYKRNNSSKHKTTSRKTQTKIQLIQPEPERYYSRSSGGLDVFNYCKLHYMTININPLLNTESHYYRKESLTIEGNPSLPYYIKNSLL